jgi:hypothetical protein
MYDAQYMTFLCERKARSYGYESHAAWVAAGVDVAGAERLARREAKERADAQAWAEAQLRG